MKLQLHSFIRRKGVLPSTLIIFHVVSFLQVPLQKPFLYTFLFSPLRATCHTHPVLLNFNQSKMKTKKNLKTTAQLRATNKDRTRICLQLAGKSYLTSIKRNTTHAHMTASTFHSTHTCLLSCLSHTVGYLPHITSPESQLHRSFDTKSTGRTLFFPP